MTSTAAAVIAVTDLPTSSVPSDGADRDAVRPFGGPTQIDRSSLTCAATTMPRWAIRTRERRRPAPVEVAAELSWHQVGVGPFPGPTRKVVDRSGVMRRIEASQPAGYSDHGVPGSLVGDLRCRAEGFPMDWSQCVS